MFLFVLLAGWWPSTVWSQLVSVRGEVRSADNGSPLEGVNVILTGTEGEQRGTATDAGGRFVIGPILPGTYVLTASYVGFTTFADTLELSFGEDRVVRIDLAPDRLAAGEIVVESERQSSGVSSAGLTTIHPSALSRVPMPGVTPDLAGYLLTLPGVVSPGDRGGQLFVRGGTAAENLVLLDGMPVYQPFHIVGFYSAFPADIIAYADVYAGGYGARYGGRLSSVIDVNTRNGNKNRVAGAVSLAPFLGSVRLELPLVPKKVSLLAVARESIIERVSPHLLREDLPFRFGDYFAKFHAYLNRTSSFSATMLRTFDEGRIRSAAGVERRTSWRNETIGGRYTYLPAEYPVVAQISAYGTFLTSRDTPIGRSRRSGRVNGYFAEINFAYLLGEHQVTFGLFGRTNRFENELGGALESTRESVTEGGMYLEGRYRVSAQIRFEPGIRIHSFSNGIATAVEPRFRTSWRPGGETGRHEFSFAGGMYHQQIVGTSNQRDVTETFTAWLPVRKNTPVPSAVHLIAGWRGQIGSRLYLSMEGYTKQLDHYRFVRFVESAERWMTLDDLDGSARGFDSRIEYLGSSVYGYAGYGWSRVRYDPAGISAASRTAETQLPVNDRLLESFSPPHDRRHQLNLMLQVNRGPYRVSLRWQYTSGQPFTPMIGFYPHLAGNATSTGYHTDPGTATIAFGAPYSSTLPAYHRMDVSVERVLRFSHVTLTLQAGVVNVYDRANLFDYDLFTDDRVDQLPIIPSAGIKVEVD